ncbi:DUF6542 domain-containing protein [Pseudonocardia spirodelae]|uniref:DUF6542 domain-containing protein n=1 Tax=Pseudonocardia spirodelae TaxID=3133431 RepID=A0ABU8T9T8_9PSEU
MTTDRSSSARRPGRSGRPARGGWPVRERSLIPPVLGVPPLAATGLAVGTTAIGVFADLVRIGTVGRVFEIAYLLGCVLAVSWVRRRGIFLPAVQPPLLLAVLVPLVAVLIGAPSGGGTAQSVLMAGAPLINAFPAMAVTTVVVLLVAGFRLLRQRLGPDDAVGRLRARLGLDPGGHDPDGPRGAPGRGAATASRSRTTGTATAATTTGTARPGSARSGTATGSRTTGTARTGSTRTGSARSASTGTARRDGDTSRGSARTGSTGRSGGTGSGRSGGSRTDPPSSRGTTRGGGTGRTRRDPR